MVDSGCLEVKVRPAVSLLHYPYNFVFVTRTSFDEHCPYTIVGSRTRDPETGPNERIHFRVFRIKMWLRVFSRTLDAVCD